MAASRLRRALSASLVVLLVAVTARSGELGGVRMADTVTVQQTRLVLNGLSLRTATLAKVPVYVIGLYLERRSEDDEKIIESPERKRVVMHFVHKVSAKDLRKGWEDGFQNNARDPKALQPQLDALEAAMRDVSKGERLVLDFVDGNVEVRFDDELAATIRGREFQKGLISCWMGPRPLTQELKAGLLGRG